MSEKPNNNLENSKQEDILSIKDLINASLKGEKKLQDEIMAKYKSKGLKEEAKEELGKLLKVFKREIREINAKSNLEHSNIQTQTKNDLASLKNELNNNQEDKKIDINKLEKELLKNYEITDKIDEFKDDVKDLGKIENKLSKYEGFDDFVNMLNSMGDDKLEDKAYSMFAELSRRDIRKIMRHYKKLPDNKETLIEILETINNKNIDSINEADEIIDINEKEFTEIGEIDYAINKIKNLIDEKGLSENQVKKLQDKLQKLKNKRNFLLKKEVDRTEKEVDRTEKEVDRTEKEVDRTEKEVDRIEKIIEGKSKIVKEKEKYILSLKYFSNIEGLQKLIKSEKIKDKAEGLDKIIKKLESGNNLNDFFNSIKEAKGGYNSEEYKEAYEFVKSLAKYSPIIQQKLDLIPVPNAPIVYSKDNMASMILGKENVHINGKGEYFSEDGEKIDFNGDKINMSVFTENGYAFDSGKVDIKDLKGDIEELKENYEYLQEKADSYYKLASLEQKIKQLGDNNEKITELLNENGFNDIQELKIELQQAKQDYDETRKEYLEKKDEIKRLFREKNEEFKKVKENKEKQKEVLEFLHKTGFDLIPQQFTDQLINEYKFNVFDIPGLKLNPERLDLANGMFGEEPNEAGVGKTQWKQNLVKFLNKLIYGEINPKNSPLNPNAFIGVMGATINPTELQAIFEQQGIKSGYMWNINEMRKNLKSQEQKEK